MLNGNPLRGFVAAVSVGIVDGEARLDLDYAEDFLAHTDMNVVMADDGRRFAVFGVDGGFRVTDAACPHNGGPLAEGRVDFGSFTDGEVANRETRELMERVTMVVDPGLPQGVERHAWSRVTVRLRDGRTVSTDARGARGHPETPLSDEALREKFLACARTVLSPDEADGVAEQIGHLEHIPDIRALTSRLEGHLD